MGVARRLVHFSAGCHAHPSRSDGWACCRCFKQGHAVAATPPGPFWSAAIHRRFPRCRTAAPPRKTAGPSSFRGVNQSVDELPHSKEATTFAIHGDDGSRNNLKPVRTL